MLFHYVPGTNLANSVVVFVMLVSLFPFGMTNSLKINLKRTICLTAIYFNS